MTLPTFYLGTKSHSFSMIVLKKRMFQLCVYFISNLIIVSCNWDYCSYFSNCRNKLLMTRKCFVAKSSFCCCRNLGNAAAAARIILQCLPLTFMLLGSYPTVIDKVAYDRLDHNPLLYRKLLKQTSCFVEE